MRGDISKFIEWLRKNPLGSVLTVCLSGLGAVFALPQLAWLLTGSGGFMLALTLLLAPLVPYAVYRIHHMPWKPLTGIWAIAYLLGFLRMPLPLKQMPVVAISGQFCAWFLIAMVVTAAYAYFLGLQKDVGSIHKAS